MELCWSLIDYCSGKCTVTIEPIEALLQMARGLAFIHSKGFVHGSIKPSNILITQPTENVSSSQFKISDFGLRQFWPGSRCTINTDVKEANLLAAENYLPPEMLIQEDNQDNSTTDSDVFALGCVFFNYLTKGIHPFGNNWRIIFTRILEGTYSLEGNFLL